MLARLAIIRKGLDPQIQCYFIRRAPGSAHLSPVKRLATWHLATLDLMDLYTSQREPLSTPRRKWLAIVLVALNQARPCTCVITSSLFMVQVSRLVHSSTWARQQERWTARQQRAELTILVFASMRSGFFSSNPPI